MDKEVAIILELQLKKIAVLEQLILKHHPEWREEYQTLTKKAFGSGPLPNPSETPVLSELLKKYLGSPSDE